MELHARSSASEITAEVLLGSRACVFSYMVARGSFLGLPKPRQAETSPTAVSPATPNTAAHNRWTEILQSTATNHKPDLG